MKEYTLKVFNNGTKEWFLNGERHREDGPAIELPGGAKKWFLNGKRHREDGPAVEYSNRDREWWLNGDKLTEGEFKARTQDTQTKELTTKEIEEFLGFKVKIVREQ